jgi:hypothetical protein
MATFKSDKAQAAAARRYSHRGLVIEHATYSGSATLSAGDVIQMVKVPAGARVKDWSVSTNDLGSSSTATLRLGDGLDTERYFGSAQISDGVTRIKTGAVGNHADHGYEYSADDTVDLVVASLGGNSQTSNPSMKLTLSYYCDN